jgi:hypothetical protein
VSDVEKSMQQSIAENFQGDVWNVPFCQQSSNTRVDDGDSSCNQIHRTTLKKAYVTARRWPHVVVGGPQNKGVQEMTMCTYI